MALDSPSPHDDALAFLTLRSKYLSKADGGINDYEFWIADLMQINPRAYEALRSAIASALDSQCAPLIRAGLQSLVVLERSEDVAIIESMVVHSDDDVAHDARICLEELQYRLLDWHQRLERVVDRTSFVRFVEALAAERDRAVQIERAEPEKYILNGALGWNNGDIASFLGQCADSLSSMEPELTQDIDCNRASWRLFAEALYCGKILE